VRVRTLKLAIRIRIFVIGLTLIATALPAAQTRSTNIAPDEQRDYNAAAKAFADRLQNFGVAERHFSIFLKNWPTSSLRPAAIVYLARSQYHRGTHAMAIQLLESNLSTAGAWADQFRYWIGECHFAAGRYDQAALAYANLLLLNKDSPLRFRAAYNEALARRREGHYSDTITLLTNPSGAFRQSAELFPKDPLNWSGQLLLAEARVETNNPEGTKDALNSLRSWELNSEQKWQRQYLLCRLNLLSGDPESALTSTTNLVQLADVTRMQSARARTYHLQSGILEQLDRIDEAVSVLTNNLTQSTPPDLRREALLKVVDLNIGRGQLTNAISTLDNFQRVHTNDAALPLALRTVGELRLRQFHLLPETNRESSFATNLLTRAVESLSVAQQKSGTRIGRSTYFRGWCHWHLKNWQAAAADFGTATENLPLSERHAIAMFKLGECHLQANSPTNAVKTLDRLVGYYRHSGRLREGLLDHALYKLVRAAIRIGDVERAEEGVQHILSWYPESYFSDRSLLFFGQAINEMGNPSEARQAFEELLERFPNSNLAPQVQVAIARTHEHERNWSSAAFQLLNWARRFPTNALLPDVEYERAWLTYQSGAPDQAFQLYTNFITKFPQHTNAPLAEKWVADYFFNVGNYVKAQERYQLLYENPNWQNTRIQYESRLAAGRAALAGGLINEATNTFIKLVQDTSCPIDLKPEVLFALGDSLGRNQMHGQAINAYSRITRDHSGHRLAPYAFGQIGNCHLQLSRPDQAREDDQARLNLAIGAYESAMKHPMAESSARTLAEFGLGEVRARKGDLVAAIAHYSNILYRRNRQNEPADFHIIRESGFALARLLENQRAYGEAIRIYERIISEFPSLKPILQPRIQRAEQLRPENGSNPLTGQSTPISLPSNVN